VSALYAPFTGQRPFLTPSLRLRPHPVGMNTKPLIRLGGILVVLAIVVLAVIAVRMLAIVNANPHVAEVFARALAFPL
jgi:hypothetical protein